MKDHSKKNKYVLKIFAGYSFRGVQLFKYVVENFSHHGESVEYYVTDTDREITKDDIDYIASKGQRYNNGEATVVYESF